jgi:hypothetical protein
MEEVPGSIPGQALIFIGSVVARSTIKLLTHTQKKTYKIKIKNGN